MTRMPGKPVTEQNDPEADYATLIAEARSAYESNEYRRALEILDSAPPGWRVSERACRLARQCFTRMGAVSRVLGETNRLRSIAPGEALDRQARLALGRLRETDPRWSPSVPAPGHGLAPRPNSVLHLLKESLPYVESGFTMRSRMTLAAQQRAGIEPTVVTSLGFPRYRGTEVFPSTEIVDGVVHHRLDTALHGPDTPRVPYDILLTDQARETARIAYETPPAAIQAGSGFRGFDQALVGLPIAERLDIPIVYEVRGFLEATWTPDVYWAEHGEYYHRRRIQERRCMDQAAHVITIAEAMRSEILDRGVDPGKVTVVPNAVDVNRFSPRPKRPDLIAELGLEDRLVVGYISNLGRREGIAHLIGAVATLRKRGHEIACLIVGDGPEKANLESLVEELSLGDCVALAGHVPNRDIEDFYALIDLFVVPRIDDRAARLVTPLKPLEAMAMRIPVVVSDLPALREIADPDSRGAVVEPGNSDALAETLENLVNNPAERKRIAEAGREWVLTQRTLESNAGRYRAIFDHLC